MFEEGITELRELLSTFLGKPKNEDCANGQIQFCCPCCAERKGVESDNKFNLECNVEKGVYKCWVCGDSDGMRGKISSLIKKYGNQDILSRYHSIIKNIKESSLYTLYGQDKFNDDFVDDFNIITLPDGFKYLSRDDKYAQKAYEYLEKRGLNDYFIKTYNIGYIGWSKDYNLSNRIIIPSYNQYGDLNYWVGRDYSGKPNRMRYKNPNVKKTEFVFNENLVNWYDNVTLVEGVFDHMVVPNSIPLLGKVLKKDYVLYDALIRNAKADVNIFLDDDATEDAVKIYKLLNSSVLKDRIRIIKCPYGYDASSIYEKFGVKGIIHMLRKAEKISEFDLLGIT